MQTRPNS